MQKLIIQGGNSLKGEVKIQGAKNSILPVLAGCVLCPGEVLIHNCPALSDVYSAARILNGLGCSCSVEKGAARVNCTTVKSSRIPDGLMREMRGSLFFLGALLGRTGSCTLSLPGGCELGPRPIDLHISALKQMGVSVKENSGELEFECAETLHGAKINLDFPSVGATENIILAAVLAKGETEISNAAREPEIKDLADFLNLCGADIKGAGSDKVVIRGVKKLHGCEFSVMSDRIAAATFLSAAACAGGEIVLRSCDCDSMQGIISVFRKMGCVIYCRKDSLFISVKTPVRAVRNIRTMPYPGFPTDAQPLVMSALAAAKGTSVIVETIFENRYRHVSELLRMGADIKTVGQAAIIRGVKTLYGAKVKAPDLRGGAALVTAALGAEGVAEISDIAFIDRGYESIEKSLGSLGADIKRVNF